ncbi:MAG: sulfurtransferase FdhD, partial [Desulfuromonadales bacterium]|nr:sulfurtransferase FdhD [Desulfuromonadales bacterium]
PADRPVSRTGTVYGPEFILGVMSELFVVARQYAEHGGIHSAALCDNRGLLLHAEDIGRHNTIDRIAGQSLQRGIDAGDKLLVASGRVSSEMVAKAVRLGVTALASRTSPTSLAVDVCKEFDVGLAGYVRGGKMEIYANPHRFGVCHTVKDGT